MEKEEDFGFTFDEEFEEILEKFTPKKLLPKGIVHCPLTPNRGDCLGNESLEEKSVEYKKAFEKYSKILTPKRSFEED